MQIIKIQSTLVGLGVDVRNNFVRYITREKSEIESVVVNCKH